MKKLLFTFVLMIIFFMVFFNQEVKTTHWDIEGWHWIESKDKIVLWQKEEKEYISEALVNIAVPIGSEIVSGYSVKLNENMKISEYQSNSYPLGIWRIIYNGVDSSGNIYLKIIRNKNNIKNQDFQLIKKEIKKISNIKGEEENLIEMRYDLFISLLDNYLKKESEVIVVDLSKTLVINSINDIPPLDIELSENHTVINISVVKLE